VYNNKRWGYNFSFLTAQNSAHRGIVHGQGFFTFKGRGNKMRQLMVLTFVLAIAMAVMVGCGGDGSAPVDTVPQSSANYTGPQDPAVLDSTTNTQNLGVTFLGDLNRIAMMFDRDVRLDPQGSNSSNTSDFVEGGDGGSYTYSSSSSSSWDETSAHSSIIQSLSFSDFADSRGVYIYYPEGPGGDDRIDLVGQSAIPLAVAPGSFYYTDLQAGRGSIYRSITFDRTTDGIPVDSSASQSLAAIPIGPGPVGSVLSDNMVFYTNYDAFYTSQWREDWGYYLEDRQTQFLQSGFTSADNMSGPYDTTTGYTPFNDTLSADYAMDYFSSFTDTSPNQETNHYTQALLDFNQSHAWNLSTAALISSGTYCAEGDVDFGCVDFDVSLTWNYEAPGTHGSCRHDRNLVYCYGWPEDGSITLEADGASASFAFTPSGGTFTFDAGNGSDPFETNLVPPPN
jgi:hypothetical protein